MEKIKQICLKTTDEYKNKAVAALIDRLNPYLMIVFCMSKERTKELGDWLGMQGYNVDVLHGEMSPAKRKTVMKAFRDAKIQILVASDLAARGLDVEGVTHVVNYVFRMMSTGMFTASAVQDVQAMRAKQLRFILPTRLNGCVISKPSWVF